MEDEEGGWDSEHPVWPEVEIIAVRYLKRYDIQLLLGVVSNRKAGGPFLQRTLRLRGRNFSQKSRAQCNSGHLSLNCFLVLTLRGGTKAVEPSELLLISNLSD